MNPTSPNPSPASRRSPNARRLRRAVALLAAPAILLLLAACGSGGSSTITVGNENKADNALIKSGESSKGKPSETSESSSKVKTPTSGPLSKEPHVIPPTGPAPKTLQITNWITGKGAEAKNGDTVTVNYVGVLYKTGKEFDASWKRNEPFSFTLGQPGVIEGWQKGVRGMKVGGRRELVIPSALAYGSKGTSGIPANETLVFVIDLLSV